MVRLSVPFTAFHPVPVWLLWMKWPRRFDFVALTVGATVPDLFEFLFLLGILPSYWELGRNWSHSILGALTVDALLAVSATTLIVRPLLIRANRASPSGLWSRFGGQEFLARRSWPVTVVSAWIGALSHVLTDVPFHAVFRLLYPAANVLLYPLQFDLFAHLAADSVLGPAAAYLLYVYWWRPSRSPRETRSSRTETG